MTYAERERPEGKTKLGYTALKEAMYNAAIAVPLGADNPFKVSDRIAATGNDLNFHLRNYIELKLVRPDVDTADELAEERKAILSHLEVNAGLAPHFIFSDIDMAISDVLKNNITVRAGRAPGQ